ncbi:ABC transporter ATP-binding protein [Marihabitans asiaticum]|uniref:Putative ABC transport system ATP-binding protein n=1 Tax=Marihabitans asiaticum TaxID=415218 RepID=A0A560WB16_9MICO|nr:ABC transporter ATP-binding protein [Marihabitans asiaticum]TWD14720.1 putative ABC transport system ATP-binding protein [Marihabitans asiaticum]
MSHSTTPSAPDLSTSTSSVRETVRRGLALSPELTQGLAVTVALAALMTLGRVVVPVAVQQTVDRGLGEAGGVDAGAVALTLVGCATAVVVTAWAARLVNIRLFRASEAGLATLRTTAFRHMHDLSVLTQTSQRRGSMVARVTSDVDTISQFAQFGGITLVVSLGQIVVSALLMAFYSPMLLLVVLATFVPLTMAVSRLQPMLGRAYLAVRERVADMLAAISEAIGGAETIRAHHVQGRTAARIDHAVEEHRRAGVRAHVRSTLAFSTGQLFTGLTLATVLAVGTWMAAGGRITLGQLLAFIFLVTLFTQPVQIATEVLNELQNAVAGWRRVLDLVDTPADVADPGDSGVDLPRGPVTLDLHDVDFAYPGGEPVLHGITWHVPARARVAIVGETGSGKSTLAKLVTRLVDPSAGTVCLDGVDIREVRFATLRDRVAFVPQEGFLFDADLAVNAAVGAPEATGASILAAIEDLGLTGWVDSLPAGLATPVGPAGSSLSAGERQLVAVIRAYLSDPDLLVLDEATSAVDPRTDVRIQVALERLMAGRTSLTIAHRLSTAEAADEVVVVEQGRIVEQGHHRDLVRAGGT